MSKTLWIAGAAGLGLALSAVALHHLPAHAQDRAAETHAAPTAEQMAEHQRQLTAVLKVVLEHADYEALDSYFAELIRANADEIGGDTEAMLAHVHGFLAQVAASVEADPQHAADHVAHMLIDAHRPQP